MSLYFSSSSFDLQASPFPKTPLSKNLLFRRQCNKSFLLDPGDMRRSNPMLASLINGSFGSLCYPNDVRNWPGSGYAITSIEAYWPTNSVELNVIR